MIEARTGVRLSRKARAAIKASKQHTSAETRARMSDSLKRQWRDPATRPGMLARASKVTRETRAQITAARWTAKARAESSARQKGRKCSALELERLKAINLGRVHSLETKAKMSAAHLGKKFSATHRAKLSANAKNRPPEFYKRLMVDRMKHEDKRLQAVKDYWAEEKKLKLFRYYVSHRSPK